MEDLDVSQRIDIGLVLAGMERAHQAVATLERHNPGVCVLVTFEGTNHTIEYAHLSALPQVHFRIVFDQDDPDDHVCTSQGFDATEAEIEGVLRALLDPQHRRFFALHRAGRVARNAELYPGT
jgi:hypothetical protein